MDGVWAAPGRVNLIGEHTDYNAGFALPFALDRRVLAHIAVAGADSLGSAYVEGVVLGLRRDGHPVPPLEVSLSSDLPIGVGLSSSAAVTCSVALGVNELFGLGLSREDLVLVAQRAENEYAGAPTGILDQSASLLCSAGHALLLDCEDRSTRQIPLDLEGAHLLVVDTGVTHDLADGSYAERRQECSAAAGLLGVASLRHADSVATLPEPLRRRAVHVVSENQRVLDVVAALEGGDLGAVGELLSASHASLRDDFEVSWPAADKVVEAALAAGSLGARMIGGGFGGSVLVLTRDVARARAAAAPWAREVFEVRSAGPAVRVV